jgi:inward rectifier potassium channel
MTIVKPAHQRSRTLRFGNRRLISKGMPYDFWRDLYHHSMTVSWPLFILGVATVFLLLNVLFAGAFALGRGAIANVPPGSFAHFVYFSIETLATVGYGDMHPQTHYGHVIASLEMFSGLVFAAVITGLIFARFSRPRARFVFAEVATISIHEGKPTLSIRVANARLNLIGNATAKMWLARNEVTAEGIYYRRFHELPLVKSENPIFALSWSIFHVVDRESVLWNVGPEEFKDAESSIILTVQGRDDSFGQDVMARRSYGAEALRWNETYSEIIESNDEDRIVINYGLFHQTEADRSTTRHEIAAARVS